MLDDGKTLDPDTFPDILETYHRVRCSLVKTAKELVIPLGTLRRWRKQNKEFGEALTALDEMLVDEVRQVYIEKALDPTTKNPAYAIFFLKANDPKYANAGLKKTPDPIKIVIEDKTFGREKST